MDKENEIVTGEVARVNKNIVYVNLGRIEAIMTQLSKYQESIIKLDKK